MDEYAVLALGLALGMTVAEIDAVWAELIQLPVVPAKTPSLALAEVLHAASNLGIVVPGAETIT